jgi:hypothetical protein
MPGWDRRGKRSSLYSETLLPHASLPFPFGRLVRMRRLRQVRILTRFAGALGRFDRVVVVSFFRRGPCFRLFLLDHDLDPNAHPPDDDPTGNRQG